MCVFDRSQPFYIHAQSQPSWTKSSATIRLMYLQRSQRRQHAPYVRSARSINAPRNVPGGAVAFFAIVANASAFSRSSSSLDESLPSPSLSRSLRIPLKSLRRSRKRKIAEDDYHPAVSVCGKARHSYRLA